MIVGYNPRVAEGTRGKHALMVKPPRASLFLAPYLGTNFLKRWSKAALDNSQPIFQVDDVRGADPETPGHLALSQLGSFTPSLEFSVRRSDSRPPVWTMGWCGEALCATTLLLQAVFFDLCVELLARDA